MNWDEVLKKYTFETLEFIKSGKDISVTQGQLYLKELIKWELFFNLYIALVCLVVFAVGAICLYKAIKRFIENDNGLAFAAIIITFFISLGSIVQCIDSSARALKAYVAPRVVIMEKLQGVLK